MSDVWCQSVIENYVFGHSRGSKKISTFHFIWKKTMSGEIWHLENFRLFSQLDFRCHIGERKWMYILMDESYQVRWWCYNSDYANSYLLGWWPHPPDHTPIFFSIFFSNFFFQIFFSNFFFSFFLFFTFFFFFYFFFFFTFFFYFFFYY